MKASTRKLLFVFAVAVAVGVASAWLLRWVQIDRCLDAGSRWNHDVGACENDGAA